MYGTAFETLKASSKNDVSTRNEATRNQEQTQTVLFPILVEDRSLQARSISRLGCRLSGIEIEKRKGKRKREEGRDKKEKEEEEEEEKREDGRAKREERRRKREKIRKKKKKKETRGQKRPS